MGYRNKLSMLGNRVQNGIIAVMLVGLLTGVSAQENSEPSPPTHNPQNVEQSIEALFGPENPEETKQEDTPVNNEPPIYISDTENGRIVIIRGIGGDDYTTIGLPGFGFGRFLRPSQIWVDYQDRLYIADSGNNRIVRIDQDSEEVWTELGGFTHPMGVAVDKSGVYIADTKANRVVRVDEIVEGSEVQEEITHPQMTRPSSLWIDGAGDLYICSGDDPPGGKVFKTWMDKEHRRWRIFSGDGLTGSRFRPTSMITTRTAVQLIDDSGERVVSMRDLEGTRLREVPYRDGRQHRLSRPQGLAVDESGQRFFIADTGNDRVLEVRADGTIVGAFYGREEDPTSFLRNPTSVFVHSSAPAPDPEEDDEDDKGKKKR